MSSTAPIPHYSFKQKLKLFSMGICNWKIKTYTTGDELFKLYSLSKTLPDFAKGVEIGSYIGASSLMIAKGLKKDSVLYCIDTWHNDAMTEGNWDTYKEFMDNTKSVKERVKAIKASSSEAGNNFTEQIDFLFVDGNHEYEGVKEDIDIWFPKLKSNGIIVMHDISWAEGVIRVMEEDIKPEVKVHESLPNMFWGWKK